MRLRRARTIRVELNAGGASVLSPSTGAALHIIKPGSPESALEVTRAFPRGTGRFAEHVHLDFSETFSITQGLAEASLGGDTVRLRKGETFYAPCGMTHVNPYSVDDGAALEFTQTFDPPTEGACSYIQTLECLLRDGLDHDGELPLSVMLAIGDVTRERTYLTRLPSRAGRLRAPSYALQRTLLLPAGRLLAGIGEYPVYLTDGARSPSPGEPSVLSDGAGAGAPTPPASTEGAAVSVRTRQTDPPGARGSVWARMMRRARQRWYTPGGGRS